MAEAASPPPLHRGLPDEIAIWEILIRLPPQIPPPLPRRLPHLALHHLLPGLHSDYPVFFSSDHSYQVYTLGSSLPPRNIDKEGPYGQDLSPNTHLLFHGSLHWCMGSILNVFDTTAESFRQMLAPVVHRCADKFVMDESYGIVLFEMDGMLSMSILNDEFTSIGIWAMQDYEREVWALKYRVELPLADLTVQFGKFIPWFYRVSASSDGDVMVLAQFGEWLLQLDMNGKLVATLRHGRGFFPTRHRLKQTLVQHTFFPTLEGYVVNAWPFI